MEFSVFFLRISFGYCGMREGTGGIELAEGYWLESGGIVRLWEGRQIGVRHCVFFWFFFPLILDVSV